MFQLHEIPFECALSELLAKSSELGWCTGVLAGEWNGERPGRTIKHPFMKGQMICHTLIEKREQHNQRIIKNECGEYLELPIKERKCMTWSYALEESRNVKGVQVITHTTLSTNELRVCVWSKICHLKLSQTLEYSKSFNNYQAYLKSQMFSVYYWEANKLLF